MKNPHSKKVVRHPDADSIYNQKIEPYEQLRSLYDGLTWLIAHNYKIGEHVKKNYYVIKSYEHISSWHQENYDVETLPIILILYSVEGQTATIEGITLKEG